MKFAIALIASLFVVAVRCVKELPTEEEIRAVYNEYKHDKDQGKDKDKEHGLSLEEMQKALDEKLGLRIKEAYAKKFFDDADTDDDNHLDEDEFLILTLYLKAHDDDLYIQEEELEAVVVAVKSIFPEGQTTKDLFKQANIIKDDDGLNFEEFRIFIYFHLGDTDNDNKLNKAELKDLLGKIGNDKITANSDTLFGVAQTDGDLESLSYDEAWPLLYFAIQEKANDDDEEMDLDEFRTAVTKIIDPIAAKFKDLDSSTRNGKLSFTEFKKAAKWFKTSGRKD